MIYLGSESFVYIVTIDKNSACFSKADVYLIFCITSVLGVSISSCGDKIH